MGKGSKRTGWDGELDNFQWLSHVIPFYLHYFFIKFKDQGQILFLLIMRIQKLLLIIEIYKEMTELFKVTDKAQGPKRG